MLSIIFIDLVIASLFYWNVAGNGLSANFPIVIVAGTQKSGTTVLAAYLSQHPNISMSETKELHHFDKNRIYKQGMDKYFSKFTPTEHSVYIGEVMCSLGACFPRTHLKMIVLFMSQSHILPLICVNFDAGHPFVHRLQTSLSTH